MQYMKLRRVILSSLAVLTVLITGCETVPATPESTELNVSSVQLDILETCRRNIGIASPDTLRAALNLLEESDVGKSETGREYAYYAARLLNLVYPVVTGSRGIPEAPVKSIFPDFFDTVEAGKYPETQQASASYLSVLAAPVSVLFTDDKDVEAISLDNINQAVSMNPRAVLPFYLRGRINERSGKYDDALADYSTALEIDPSCYPAEMGTARVYLQTGRNEAAAGIMDLLAAQYPYSLEILTAAADTHYRLRDYSGALSISSEILERDPDYPEAQLLRAKIFLDQQNVQQAERLVAVLERMVITSPDFYLIKAGVQKAYERYAAALNTLEKGLEIHPGDPSLEDAYGEILLLAGRKDEGREILDNEDPGRQTETDSLLVLIRDATVSGDVEAALDYADRLDEAALQTDDLLMVWELRFNSNQTEKALKLAEDMYARAPEDADAVIAYARTLISLYRRLQAQRIIDENLPLADEPEKRSSLYFLKSLIEDDDELKLQALRSALFEDLQNIEALVEISRLYSAMGDYRKAFRYLKQAAALAPEDDNIAAELSALQGLVDDGN